LQRLPVVSWWSMCCSFWDLWCKFTLFSIWIWNWFHLYKWAYWKVHYDRRAECIRVFYLYLQGLLQWCTVYFVQILLLWWKLLAICGLWQYSARCYCQFLLPKQWRPQQPKPFVVWVGCWVLFTLRLGDVMENVLCAIASYIGL